MLEEFEIAKIMQDMIFTVVVASAPLLLVGLVIGLIISIFQATTQINEQTLAFVPKIIAVFAALLIFGGWMLSRLTGFTREIFDMMGSMFR